MFGSAAVPIIFIVLALGIIIGVREIASAAARQRRENEENDRWREEEKVKMGQLIKLSDAFKAIKEEFDALCEGMEEEELNALWKPAEEKVSQIHIIVIKDGFAAAVPLQIEANTEAENILAARKQALGISD